MAQQTFTGRKRVRKFFGHIKEVAEMPNLIEVQKASYDQFLMVDEPPGGRLDEGLQAVFRSVFPISDFSNTSMLEFVRYEFFDGRSAFRAPNVLLRFKGRCLGFGAVSSSGAIFLSVSRFNPEAAAAVLWKVRPCRAAQ